MYLLYQLDCSAIAKLVNLII